MKPSLVRHEELVGLRERLSALIVRLDAQIARHEAAVPRRPEAAASPAVGADHLYKARRHRDLFFDPDLFGEPAWDMLLGLLVAHRRGRPLRLTEAWDAGRTTPASGLRWLNRLEAAGLVERRGEAGAELVSLSAAAAARLGAYLSDINPG